MSALLPEYCDDDAENAAENAASLIASFGVPPQWHSVWVHTAVNDEKEFVRSYRVAIHPSVKHIIALPDEHCGRAVKRVAWGSCE